MLFLPNVKDAAYFLKSFFIALGQECSLLPGVFFFFKVNSVFVVVFPSLFLVVAVSPSLLLWAVTGTINRRNKVALKRHPLQP